MNLTIRKDSSANKWQIMFQHSADLGVHVILQTRHDQKGIDEADGLSRRVRM